MVIAVFALARSRNLFSVVVLFSLYSFLLATVLAVLDAVDVAMTEAAVGAGISTVLFLGALLLCRREEASPMRKPWLPLSVSVACGLLLAYGSVGMPAFSDASSPPHQHVGKHYLTKAPEETGIPNVVTAVLGSYRGYDTLGEVMVVFTAGAGVVALLRRRRRDKLP